MEGEVLHHGVHGLTRLPENLHLLQHLARSGEFLDGVVAGHDARRRRPATRQDGEGQLQSHLVLIEHPEGARNGANERFRVVEPRIASDLSVLASAQFLVLFTLLFEVAQLADECSDAAFDAHHDPFGRRLRRS